jgi:membrane-associated phospholipid phosphatase
MGRGLIVYLDYLSHCKTGTFSKAPFKVLFAVFTVVFGVTVGYSRLILGDHGLNQVLFGWQIGAWVAFTCQYCMYKPYCAYIEPVLEGSAKP